MNPSVFSFESLYADGRPLSLADFAGQVLLIVNTASRCGFTPQYAGLETLQETYRERGFSVVAFPCNQFGGQEPGSSEDAAAFCVDHYRTSFPVSEKIRVKGPEAHPLFAHLTRSRPGILGTRAIKWNFTKFLVDRKGRVVRRFGPWVPPSRIAGAIERLLDEGAV